MNLASETDRIETDSIGSVEIPASAYYGPQTARAVQNFQISGIPIRHFSDLLRSLAYVKMAAARANVKLGNLDARKGELICLVCEEIISGQHHGEFPVDVFQGGAGTSTNMNINEVIANRGLEILGLPRGRYDALHPNNDVNLSQSTNDVYATAIRLAILLSSDALVEKLDELAVAFEAKGAEFAEVIRA